MLRASACLESATSDSRNLDFLEVLVILGLLVSLEVLVVLVTLGSNHRLAMPEPRLSWRAERGLCPSNV